MLKKLLGRHRSLRIGATIVGASALAIGFASPAFAAQNVNNGNADNANAQNYNIVQGGSNTAYLLMQGEAALFNESPGCDLVGQTSTAASGVQPLDYGCPGLASETGTAVPGTAQAAAAKTSFTGVAVTTGNKKYVLTGSAADGVEAGDEVYDSAGDIPLGDPVKTFNSATGKIKLAEGATGNDASDTITVVTDAQQGENGFSNWGQQNPFNDNLVEEPSYGSSNGVLELEGTGSASVVGHSATTLDPTSNTNAVPVSPLDAARSSRAPKLASGGDYQGLNFVAYAEDAVSYLYWDSYNGTSANSTDAAKCIGQIGAANVTTAELKLVFNETYTGGVPNETWAGVFGCSTAGSTNPIYAYWAQNGSGTESTWATATGASFPGSASNWPGKQIIFENETSSILSNNGAGSGHGAPVGDAMFFFSHGRYGQICTPNAAGASTSATCAGTSTTTTANTVQLGQTLNNIALNQADINNQLPGLEGSAFPGDRLLYNVYSNGSNANIPASNPATLNAVSEDGFMCKPSTTTDIDPNTGQTYRTEIDAAITGQGFTPLPNLQVEDGQGDVSGGATGQYTETASGIPHPAWNDGLSASAFNAANETVAPFNFNPVNTDTDNSAVSGTYSGVENGSATLGNATASATAPVGFCITESTDGSAGGS